MPKIGADLTGRTFGRLVVTGRAGRSATGRTLWKCRCECGESVDLRSCNLLSGNTASCGCLHREVVGRLHRTHGKCQTDEHEIWKGMLARCLNPNHSSYPNYGGRGITVCGSWRMSFTAFLADVGSRPSPEHSLDRIDNDGNYKPGNVRWATRAEQSENRRVSQWVEFNGVRKLAGQWERDLGFGIGTISGRLRSGWSIQAALTVPARQHRIHF
jgi:hypothetical protein